MMANKISSNIELKPYMTKMIVKIEVNQKTYNKMFQRTLNFKHQAHSGFIFGINNKVPDDVGHGVNIDDKVLSVMQVEEFYRNK